jgi:type IV pilus assembly protein PilQ
MTVTRGLALFLSVAAAGALVSASGPTATTTTVRLKTISARVNAKGASLVIEASEPVAYTATRPDPLTVVLDFRNVAADEVANSVVMNAQSPITRVSVESSESLGAPASRVRIALAQPVAHRVRSDRNTIVVDFDKPSAKAVPYVLPPPARESGVGSRESKTGAPDAMMALKSVSVADPIAALGLDAPVGGPSAAPATVASVMLAPAAPAPVAAPAPAVAPIAAPIVIRAAALQQPAPQAPAPPAPPEQFSNPRAGQRQFTGHPVSLDFQGADLRAVLRTFAEISGLNIVIDPTVQGTVDVALRDVPWDQALDIILRANKLGYAVDGTIVRIAPNAVLKSEEDERKALLESQNDASQLGTLQRQLSYAKGEEVATLLKSANVLTKRGQANVDPRTNTLIVRDVPTQFPEISSLIDGIDRAQPQVEIEARIVQTNKDYARALGVQWGFNGNVSPALGNTTPLAFPNSGSLGGRVGGSQGPTGATAQPTTVNLGVPGASSAIGLALGSVNGAFGLDVALSALERSGNGRLLSTPRVTTQNNVSAEMTQGVQIPIQTVANNTVTVSFKDAALTLKVTPQITAANTVIMQISVENASPDFSRAVNNIPPINTQRANTQVLVSDGQTTVIGGIYVSQEQSSNDRTPVLSRIPLLGWLFKRDTLNDQSTELLIFITPRIIKG